MKTSLLNNLNEEEAKHLKENFIHSKVLRDRLIEVLNQEISSLYTDMQQEKWFESPNWDKIQADRLAQIKARKKFISLLSEKSL